MENNSFTTEEKAEAQKRTQVVLNTFRRIVESARPNLEAAEKAEAALRRLPKRYAEAFAEPWSMSIDAVVQMQEVHREDILRSYIC